MAKTFMEYVRTYGVLGFIAALVTGFLLKTISQIVSLIPGVTVDLQSISVQTEGVGAVIGTGLSTYAQKIFGAVQFVSVADWIYVGIGGALFVMLGAYVVDNVKMLQFAKTKQGKLATIFVAAGIVSGWILSASIGIPAIGAIIAMSVNAYILSFVLVFVDDMLGTKLVMRG
jgi:hypothetical protein